jgi:hypothetical protein
MHKQERPAGLRSSALGQAQCHAGCILPAHWNGFLRSARRLDLGRSIIPALAVQYNRVASLERFRMSMVEINGYAAALAVLATFLMTTMIPLRVLALASNVLFVSYGYFNEILPVLVLHAILFPVNLHRLF